MPAAFDLAPLAAMAAITFLILLLFAYKATVGAVVDWLIRSIPQISVTVLGRGVHDVFGWIRGPLEAFNNLVYHTLGGLIDADKAVWNKFVHWNAYAWSELSGAVADVAAETEKALGYLARHKLAALIAVTVGPIAATIYTLRSRIAALEAAGARIVTKTVRPVVNEINRSRTYVRKVTQGASLAAVASIAVQIPRLWRGIDDVESDVKKALRAAERALGKVGSVAAIGAVAFAIGRLGFEWVRCSRVKRLGRAVCGLDDNLLESLLADALIVASTISLVELARETQSFTKTVEAPLLSFVRELHGINVTKGPNASVALAKYAAGNF